MEGDHRSPQRRAPNTARRRNSPLEIPARRRPSLPAATCQPEGWRFESYPRSSERPACSGLSSLTAGRSGDHLTGAATGGSCASMNARGREASSVRGMPGPRVDSLQEGEPSLPRRYERCRRGARQCRQERGGSASSTSSSRRPEARRARGRSSQEYSAMATHGTGEPQMATEIPAAITIPDSIDTRLGTLRFVDGFPDHATVEKVFDNLDFQLADIGLAGLDRGQGGRLLFVPPDHAGGAARRRLLRLPLEHLRQPHRPAWVPGRRRPVSRWPRPSSSICGSTPLADADKPASDELRQCLRAELQHDPRDGLLVLRGSQRSRAGGAERRHRPGDAGSARRRSASRRASPSRPTRG